MPRTSKKKDILSLAANLFAERGYEAVSMRDLAKTLEMTPANLYHHFADKEELYRATLVDVFSRIAQVLVQPVPGESPRDYLERLVGSLITFMLEDTVFTRLMFRELSADNQERASFLVENVLRPIYDSIARGLSLLIKDSAVPNLLDMLLSSLIGFVNLSRIFSLLHRDATYERSCEAITSRIMATVSLSIANLESQ